MLSEKSEGRQILIAIEGPDYTGKSSLIAKLIDLLNDRYSHLARIPAVKVSRPGGTLQCAPLREKITNSELPRLTRQAFALAEEVLFTNTFETDSPIVIFDRYNPISGQVYGPVEMRETWQLAVTREITLQMDKVLFIQSDKEVIQERFNTRDKHDVMDSIFADKIDRILHEYEAIRTSDWTQAWCSPSVVCNNGDFDTFVAEAFKIVCGVIDERYGTIVG